MGKPLKLVELTITEYQILIWCLFVLGTIFTSLRLTVRWLNQHNFYLEDWLAFVAWCFLFIMAILYSVSAKSVYVNSDRTKTLLAGRPWTMPQEEWDHHFRIYGITQFVQMMFFWTCLWTAKLSLMAFFKRLTKGVRGYMVYWWIIFAFCVMSYVGCILTNFVACLPMSRRWTTSKSKTHGCTSTPKGIRVVVANIKFASAVDVATDLLIMMLPLPLLWGLRISLIQKIGLVFIFCLGAIVIVFALIRLKGVTDSITYRKPTASQDLSTWSMVECSVAVVVISLPPLRGFLKGKFGGSSGQYASNDRSGKMGSGLRYGTGAKTRRSELASGFSNRTTQGNSKGGHVQLQDIPLGTRNTTQETDIDHHDGFSASSQEELRKDCEGILTSEDIGVASSNPKGISKTTEVTVTRTKNLDHPNHHPRAGMPQGVNDPASPSQYR